MKPVGVDLDDGDGAVALEVHVHRGEHAEHEPEIGLRAGGSLGYTIPRGGLFEWVSCPNHMGEIIQWTGFAIMCWNLPALSVAVWTAANLIPRAVSHHKWYGKTFSDYPAGRRAVIPGVW